ncbi:sugar ABC transporter permease [Actinomyces sp. 186855]|nr:sugar ABC transporter permease [Actinomyces sp. AC-20-1]MCL3790402.1 sugar ABC transporter permease [Actinomyces sp. 187325]MCL3792627.1 sugar ABC transporter permease [Actinomyces sp. 186855]MCL3793960.1 sugar ABC transporter permease [Actinomyces sp. 217892]
MSRPVTRRRTRAKVLRWGTNLSFVLPFALVYVLFLLYPVLQAGLMSLFDWDLLGSVRDYVGLRNYTTMLGGTGIIWSAGHRWVLRLLLLLVAAAVGAWAWRGRRLRAGEVLLITSLVAVAVLMGFHPGPGGSWYDTRFWNALENTVVFTLVSTPLIAGLGLVFALLLNRPGRMTGFYRAALFVPYVLPVSMTTLVWGYLLNPSRGIVSRLTEALGMGTIEWLTTPGLAMGAVVVTTVWWTVGFNMILFGAGLQDIDPTLYEAAALDGAGPWQKLLHITLPGLRHATLLVVVTQVIASFQIFGQVNIMTSGGPAGTTDVLVRYIYQTGFRDKDLGYASAVSLFLFVLMVGVSLIQFLMSRQRKG